MNPSHPFILCDLSARELARMVRAREVSARDVMRAYLDRINAINPKINAIVAKLDDDRCLGLADEADARLARGDEVGPLHGLPFAFKDIEDVVGFPNTKGSPIYAGFMPATDAAVVKRIRAAGVLPIGKTNVSEFAMGSHSYNKVYGTTRNPYDLSKTAGGSSGGAAAALAAGLLPLADGTDLGGSLRNPGNFNNVVGFRPSIGLVAGDPDSTPGINFSVHGPLARSVDDVEFLLSTMSTPGTFGTFGTLDTLRIAWSIDLGGLPVDSRVRAVLEPHRTALAQLGYEVEDACPDFTDADDIFLTIRRFRSFHKYGDLLRDHRSAIKPEAVDEIERGARITADDLARAEGRHADLLDRAGCFFDTYDFLACAVNQLPPFDASLDWPKAIDGCEMETYTSWMKSAYWVTLLCGPAISVPCGFTSDGLPVGIQLVGRVNDDWRLLELARSFEGERGSGKTRPNLVSCS